MAAMQNLYNVNNSAFEYNFDIKNVVRRINVADILNF